jgi:tricorn protease
MFTRLLVALFACGLLPLRAAESPSAPASAPAQLLRHPSYHEGRIAFSYLGDLWLVRENGTDLRRLTDHQARDIFPRFSPDGRLIAFSSKRAGNHDVFVIPVAGGKPRQLTFHGADDNVVGWSRDGRRIVFTSARNHGVFPGLTTLFEISVDGGMERPIATDWGSWASYSPDGTQLAFTRHPGNWSRQHYRGSYAVDLWLMDVAARKSTKLEDPDYRGNYFWPMFGRDGNIYFVADRLADETGAVFGGPAVMQSVGNLWRLPAKGGRMTRITQHTGGTVLFPSMSADGRTIVYEQNFGLWKLDVASGRSTEIRVHIPSDAKDNDVVLRTVQGEADAFHLSPSTKRAAISVRGEIFTVATDRGEVQRVSETPWREQSPRWSPDGKFIAFISDRTGREEIWIADERGQNERQLSDLDADKSAPVWAPDSKSLLWAASDRTLRRTAIESGETTAVASSEHGPLESPQFSPDAKWISYTKPDRTLRPQVYVRPAAGGEEKRIAGDDFITASQARWTGDGRKLLLLGGVGAPGMASLNRTHLQLYAVTLSNLEGNPDDRDIDTEEQAQSAARRASLANPTALSANRTSRPAGTAGGPHVSISWDGLERRIRQITRLGGSVTSHAPSPDSRTYAFVAAPGTEDGPGRPTLYTVADDGSRLTVLAQGSAPDPDATNSRTSTGGNIGEPQWARDGRAVFYPHGGGIYTVGIGPAGGTTPATPSPSGSGTRSSSSSVTSNSSAPPAAPRKLAFTLRLEIDAVAQRRQVFTEAWRVMRQRFYDEAMHGVDWPAAKRRYEPLLEHVADTEELQGVISQLIGELNASHTGVSGGGDERPDRVQTRYPGFELEPDATGYFRIVHIYRKGPADHDYIDIDPGDYVLAINGRPLKPGDNVWRALTVVPGRKFEFLVATKPDSPSTRTASIVPVNATTQGNLEYERWVDERKAIVAKLSQGEVGYLHIRAMNAASYRRFQRDLLDQLDKKALVIDQRFNGGGGIDQELLEVLNQRVRYQTWRRRGSVEVSRPVQAFFGPMVVLQNERSASNAEMFPDGFRKLGLGQVIGVPTMGAVIGTGSYRLMDGSSLRTPQVGVYTASGRNMENYGVPPDIHIDNTPDDFLAGRDAQLEKAVAVLRAAPVK